MRAQVQGLSIELGGAWAAPAPEAEALGEAHGLYLAHRGTGLALHVRAWPRAGDEAALVDELRAQQWPQPPLALDRRRAGALVVAAATFRYDADRRVREWFISDGRRGANLALLHPDDAPPGVLADCEALADSVRFG